MSSDKKGKTPGYTVAAIIIFLLVINSTGIVLPLLCMAAIVIIAAVKISAIKKNGTDSGEASVEKAVSVNKEKALHFDKQSKRSARKYAAYDHDTAHRLEQLDTFLKNGIIEKKEYLLLKERYLNSRNYEG